VRRDGAVTAKHRSAGTKSIAVAGFFNTNFTRSGLGSVPALGSEILTYDCPGRSTVRAFVTGMWVVYVRTRNP
jgi:hypothetical protein